MGWLLGTLKTLNYSRETPESERAAGTDAAARGAEAAANLVQAVFVAPPVVELSVMGKRHPPAGKFRLEPSRSGTVGRSRES